MGDMPQSSHVTPTCTLAGARDGTTWKTAAPSLRAMKEMASSSSVLSVQVSPSASTYNRSYLPSRSGNVASTAARSASRVLARRPTRRTSRLPSTRWSFSFMVGMVSDMVLA